MCALAKPALSLVPSSGTGEGLTRLGGTPLLPPDASWPRWGDRPLAFLGVVDLSQLAKHGLEPRLPATGLLNFFYDVEKQPWGFDPQESAGWRVVACSSETAVEWGPADGARSFPSRRVSFEPLLSIPDWQEEPVAALLKGKREELAAFCDEWELLQDRGLPRHQVGGWPALVQSPLGFGCELASNGINAGTPEGYSGRWARELASRAGSWQLLLQLDSDDALEWMWGDAGRLFFSLREDDARQGRFDRTWLTLQCS